MQERLKRKWRIRVWVLPLALILCLLLGAGIAVAINAHTSELPLWSQQVSVVDPNHLSVDTVSLKYSDHGTSVDKVIVKVANSDTATHTATINVTVVGTVTGEGGVVGVTCTAGKTVITLDITPNVPLDGLTDINIVLEETG